MNEASIGDQADKDKLMICRRFLQKVGPYYASAIDEDLLLGRLSSANTCGSGVEDNTCRTSSSAMEILSDFVLSTPPMVAEETSDFEMLWLEGLTTEETEEWKKMSPLFVLPAEKDLQHEADGHGMEVKKGDEYSVEWTFEPQGAPDSDNATLPLTATTTASNITLTTTPTSTIATLSGKKQKDTSVEGDGSEEEHAFFTTDSGLKTFWMHPEKMASLEEATISSLEKLSMR